MEGSRRSHRMARLVRAEVARILMEEAADPRLKELVVTDVELTGDLKHAKVFFTGPEPEPKDLRKGLERSMSFFRRRLGERLELRYVPTLEFRRDKHGDSVTRLHHLFGEIAGDDRSDARVS